MAVHCLCIIGRSNSVRVLYSRRIVRRKTSREGRLPSIYLFFDRERPECEHFNSISHPGKSGNTTPTLRCNRGRRPGKKIVFWIFRIYTVNDGHSSTFSVVTLFVPTLRLNYRCLPCLSSLSLCPLFGAQLVEALIIAVKRRQLGRASFHKLATIRPPDDS